MKILRLSLLCSLFCISLYPHFVQADPDAPASFELREAVFLGNEEISSGKLERVIRKYKGKQVTLDDLRLMSEKIRLYYNKKGFPKAFVYLPAQDLIDGSVEFAIMEKVSGEADGAEMDIFQQQYGMSRMMEKVISSGQQYRPDYGHSAPGAPAPDLGLNKIQAPLSAELPGARPAAAAASPAFFSPDLEKLETASAKAAETKKE